MSADQYKNTLWDSSDIEKFAVEPARVNYAAETYVDYLRVYRKGIATVKYDTNIPEDISDCIISEVSPDTGRGVGKGYMLTGEKPEADGFTFMGWALTPNASVNDVVESIDLTGNTTVYAVWIYGDDIAPVVVQKNSIRTTSPMGLRFAAIIDLFIKNGTQSEYSQRALLGVVPDEYGFIISRKSLLNGTELDFGDGPDAKGSGTTSAGVKYVSGAAFNKDKGIDTVYDSDGTLMPGVIDGTNECFTAVLYKIPENMYDEVFVARTYICIDGKYFYGIPREAGVKATAALVKSESYDKLSQEEKDVIDAILANG